MFRHGLNEKATSVFAVPQGYLNGKEGPVNKVQRSKRTFTGI